MDPEFSAVRGTATLTLLLATTRRQLIDPVLEPVVPSSKVVDVGRVNGRLLVHPVDGCARSAPPQVEQGTAQHKAEHENEKSHRDTLSKRENRKTLTTQCGQLIHPSTQL